METIYAIKDCFSKDNNELVNRMEAVEKFCATCNIVCAQLNGKWGVGLMVNDEFLIVDPLDLVSSIYDDECHLYLEGSDNVGQFIVECRKLEFCYEWILTHTTLKNAGHRFYANSDYQSKIAEAINSLYRKILEGAEIAYEPVEAGKESIELCVKQLAIKWTLPSNYCRLSSEISMDKFEFNPCKEAERYYIGLSDRGFHSWISDWDNDYDNIRHKLENYVYDREAKIRLGFDFVDTIIEFRHRSVLKSIDECGTGYGFKYDDMCVVSIKTDDVGKSPILKGYCDERPAIRTFYEGLLLIAMNYPIDPEGNIYDYMMIDAYNKIKSPVIEQWLSDVRRDFKLPVRRETVVDNIWIIDPEYDVCIEEMLPERIPFDVVNDTFEGVLDDNGNEIVIPGFTAWRKEICEIIIKSETGKDYMFDWEDYHRRGIELAKQLRSKLPTNIDLWYRAPFEDKSSTIPRPILITR